MAWSISSALNPRPVAGSASAISNLSWPAKNEDRKRSAAPGFKARRWRKRWAAPLLASQAACVAAFLKAW
eukprot:4041199-Pyramimonas_sp.AAC.1